MISKVIPITIAVLIIAIIALSAVLFNVNKQVGMINSFDECAAAGYPIMESYPEQCRTPDGRNFVREIKPAQDDFGQERTLSLNETITFQDGLAVTLKEINDSRCKEGVVCVWAGELSYKFSITSGTVGSTTKEFIIGTLQISEATIGGYQFDLNVPKATETGATITVKNKNPETSCNFEVKVCPDESQVGRTGPNCEFTSCASTVNDGCFVGGCSGQICSDKKDVMTTCEYKAEYACYKDATCEKQASGQCGWTQTSQLTTCLAEK